MAPRITHTKVSGRAAGNDTNRIYGTHWDADHTITGLTIGTDVQAHDATLDGLAALAGPTGIVVETAADTFGNVSIVGTANRVAVTNGSGAAGNPTVDIDSAYVGQATITTVGTITTGVWTGTAVAETKGGTNQTSYTLGDMLYASASNTLSKLAGQITSTKKFLRQTGTGAVSAAPAWDTIVNGDISGAGAAFTKTDDTNVTATLGGSASTAAVNAMSITLGWTGTLSVARGGNGTGTYTQGDFLYSDATNSLARLAAPSGSAATKFLTNAIGSPPSWVQVDLTKAVTGTLPIANGGTAQTTALAARGSSGLNVESFTGHGDSIYTILATDKVVGTNAAFTASRTWTLPAANAVNAGQPLVVADFQGTVGATNTLIIARAGADTINGGTSVTINVANGSFILWSDGTSKWTAQVIGAGAASGVSSYNTATGAVATAAVQGAPSTPTGTTSATLVMMGLGSTATITPTATGRVMFTIRGAASINTTAATFHIQVRRGTGSAPANAAAVTGTQVGPDVIGDMNNVAGAAGQRLPFCIGGIVTGLSVGTAVWFDAALSASTGTASIAAGLTVDAFEF